MMGKERHKSAQLSRLCQRCQFFQIGVSSGRDRRTRSAALLYRLESWQEDGLMEVVHPG